ncbi:MAG: alkanesulfonate monooxygenase SsuD [Neolewinella sp.]|jgi:alkanesulfonate monooxygenase SsuD/methylene tetrahydromethanopterin reductase-like flavin-dependent oxidoreductase (luciferase family)
MHSVMDVVELAQTADELGFANFWLTEHHSFSATAPWASPRMLLPMLLEYTSNIAIGTAGVLINFYSPYQVALDFKLLNNLYPGRCHLGFANGRPSPSIGRQMRYEQFAEYPDEFDEKVARVAYLFNNEKQAIKKEHLVLPPAFGYAPELFSLGSSFRNYDKAVANKSHMVKSTFHALNCMDYEEYDVIARYRESFYKAHGIVPRAIIAFSGSCVPDEATRQDLEAQVLEANKGNTIVNTLIATPDEFQERIHKIAKKYGVDDFVVREVGHSNDQQKESLRLIHQGFNLTKNTTEENSLVN